MHLKNLFSFKLMQLNITKGATKNDQERSLFISHKHVDHKIANVLGDFAKGQSLNRVKVHLSSDPNYEGPKIGKNLNDQLKAGSTTF